MKKTISTRKILYKITCFKCGKIEHMANKCKVKKKVRKIYANYPNIHQKIISLFELKYAPIQLEYPSSSHE